MPSVKEIYEKITDVTIDADTINLNTDTVESLLSTVQADVALVKADIANGVLSDVRDGTGNAITSSARGSQRALSVQIVDGSGNQVTTFGSSSVSVSNFPATQPVSGAVSVSNFPATQPVSLASVPSHPVTGTFWQATQPVSLASAPVTPVTDNGGSLTVDGSITATQSTASSLKAQAQLLNAAGTVVEYATTGSAGTPATDVVSVQGVVGGTAIPVSVATFPATQVVSGTVNTYPLQGATVSRSDFTSTTADSPLVSAVAGREVLTVFNEGSGNLYISAGSTCTLTSYQVRLSSGDYWECPAGQTSLAHSAVFGAAGTARVTQVS